MNRRVVPLYENAFEIPLLQAKLVVPRILAALADRPRIYTRLDALFQDRLVLVTAPPGLARHAQWLSGSGM